MQVVPTINTVSCRLVHAADWLQTCSCSTRTPSPHALLNFSSFNLMFSAEKHGTLNFVLHISSKLPAAVLINFKLVQVLNYEIRSRLIRGRMGRGWIIKGSSFFAPRAPRGSSSRSFPSETTRSQKEALRTHKFLHNSRGSSELL